MKKRGGASPQQRLVTSDTIFLQIQPQRFPLTYKVVSLPVPGTKGDCWHSKGVNYWAITGLTRYLPFLLPFPYLCFSCLCECYTQEGGKMATKATSKGSQKLFTCKQCKEPFTQPQGKSPLICGNCGTATVTAESDQQGSSPQWVQSLTAVMQDLSSELQASRQDREKRTQESEPAWAQALAKSLDSLVQVVSAPTAGPPLAK